MENDKRASHGSLLYLGVLCFVAALGGFLFGFDTAVISGTISFVKQKFAMSAMAEGWFVSSALAGCIFGVAFSGKLSDSFGRKKVMILSALFFLVTGVGCALAVTQSALGFFRMVGGLGVGIASMVSPLYISEFSPPRLRGRLVALYQLAITLGILVAYFSNAYLLRLSTAVQYKSRLPRFLINEEVWRGMFAVDVVPALIFIGLLLFVPETPRWLAGKGRGERALCLLSRVSGRETAEKELAEINAVLKVETGSLRRLFTPAYRPALLIGLTLPLLSQFSGINAVIYYGPRILDQAGFALSDALGGQVTIGIVNVLFTFVAIYSIDKWGRRPLLMFGVAGAVISLLAGGLLFALNVTQGVLILLPILCFIACFAFSFGPVCWVILGEIYPTAIRGRAMSLATMTIWIGNFFVGQLTPLLLENLGPAGTFWIFALLCSPAFFITWKLVPETKGRSLEDIEAFWLRKAHKSVEEGGMK